MVLLAVLANMALAAQDRFTLKAPNGIAFLIRGSRVRSPDGSPTLAGTGRAPGTAQASIGTSDGHNGDALDSRGRWAT